MLACTSYDEISVWSSWNDDVATGGMSCFRRFSTQLPPPNHNVHRYTDKFLFTSNNTDQYVACTYNLHINFHQDKETICIWDVSGPANQPPSSRLLNSQGEINNLQSMAFVESKNGSKARLFTLLENKHIEDKNKVIRKRYLNVVSVPEGNRFIVLT